MTVSESTEQPMPRREFVEATHASVVVAGVVLAVGGWSGLAWVVTNTLPTVPNRWAFYALLQIALTGTALPFVRFLTRRFARGRGLFVPPGVLVRQATWVGLFGTTCAWLRIPRLLSIPLVILLALALIAIEFLLRMRERMQQEPE
jgi:hypothetical protein